MSLKSLIFFSFLQSEIHFNLVLMYFFLRLPARESHNLAVVIAQTWKVLYACSTTMGFSSHLDCIKSFDVNWDELSL